MSKIHLAICLLPLWLALPWLSAQDPAPAAETPTVPEAPAQAAGNLPVRLDMIDAIEGLVDEDEPTRQQAMARLNAADDADRPALEKYAHHQDPEIRRQVELILKRLKRGALTYSVTFPNGKPIAGGKFTVSMYLAKDVQSYPTGMAGGEVQFMYKAPRQGIAQPDFSVEATADANGQIHVGRFNDDDYLVVVESQDPLPRQTKLNTVNLREKTDAQKVTFKRGVTVTVTVQDENGQPAPEVTVGNVENEQWLQSIESNLANGMNNFNGFLRQLTTVPTDEKGVAVFNQIGLERVQIIAIKEGYELKTSDKLEIEDGGTGSVTLKLAKIQPTQFTMTVKPMGNLKKVGDLRTIACPANKVMQVVGGNWYQLIDAAQVDTYIKNGALDLGKTDDKGTVQFEGLPGQYWVFYFIGKDIYFAQTAFSARAPKQAVQAQQLQRR